MYGVELLQGELDLIVDGVVDVEGLAEAHFIVYLQVSLEPRLRLEDLSPVRLVERHLTQALWLHSHVLMQAPQDTLHMRLVLVLVVGVPRFLDALPPTLLQQDRSAVQLLADQ